MNQAVYNFNKKQSNLSLDYIYGYREDNSPIINREDFVSRINNGDVVLDYIDGNRIETLDGNIWGSSEMSPRIVGRDKENIPYCGKTLRESSFITIALEAHDYAHNLFHIQNHNTPELSELTNKKLVLTQELKTLLDVQDSKLIDIKNKINELNDVNVNLNTVIDKDFSSYSQIEKDLITAKLVQNEASKLKVNGAPSNLLIGRMATLVATIQDDDERTLDSIKSGDNNDLELSNKFSKMKSSVDNIEKNYEVHLKRTNTAFWNEKLSEVIVSNDKTHRLDSVYTQYFSEDDELLKEICSKMPNVFEKNEEKDKLLYAEVAEMALEKIMNDDFMKGRTLPDGLLRRSVMSNRYEKVLEHIETLPQEKIQNEIEHCYRILFEKAEALEKTIAKAEASKDSPDDIKALKEELIDLYINQIHNLNKTLCNNQPKTLSSNQAGLTYSKEVAVCLNKFLKENPQVSGSCLFQMIHSLPMFELEAERQDGSIIDNITDRFDLSKRAKSGAKFRADDVDLLSAIVSHTGFDYDKHKIDGQRIDEYIGKNNYKFASYVNHSENPNAAKLYNDVRELMEVLNGEKVPEKVSLKVEYFYQKHKAQFMANVADYKNNFMNYSISDKIYYGILTAMESVIFAVGFITKLVIGSSLAVIGDHGRKEAIPFKINYNPETHKSDVMIKVDHPVHGKASQTWEIIGHMDKNGKFNQDVKNELLDKLQLSAKEDIKHVDLINARIENLTQGDKESRQTSSHEALKIQQELEPEVKPDESSTKQKDDKFKQYMEQKSQESQEQDADLSI